MDLVVFEEEADRRSNEALLALKSSTLNDKNSFYTPTWTGKNGTNQNKKRKAPSSTQLLKCLSTGHSLKQLETQKGENSIFNDLLNFMQKLGGSATTQQLIDQFSNRVNKGLESQVFKRVLKQICIFKNVNNQRNMKKWVLKNQFKSFYSKK